ncbi:MAG: hypothetical protein KDA60_22540, partial [Planctomycetales bacterium]|nr:hypothetical protein [Planctomycetales bacterium]
IGACQLYLNALRPTPYDLRMLGDRAWIPGSTATLRLAVVDPESRQTLTNVRGVLQIRDVRRQRSDTLADFTIGEQGEAVPRFTVPDWEDGDYQLVFTAYPGGAAESVVETIHVKRAWKLMLSSDKPIYQPGQTVHLRSLALRQPDLRPVAGQRVEYRIYDPKGNTIFKHTDVTSRYGITSCHCALATLLNLGTYRVECIIDGVTAERSIEVQRYVLPKFKVVAQFDRAFYEPGQTIGVEVRADYFFGKPVTNAKVVLQVHQQAAGAHRLGTQEATTDEQGIARLELTLPNQLVGTPQEKGDAQIQATITVIDSAGQEYSLRHSRIVTTRPIRLEVIPESSPLVPGEQNRIYLYTGYVDGRPAKTRIIVEGLDQEIETNELGVGTFSIDPDDRSADVLLRVIDEEGRELREKFSLSKGTSGDFLVRTDKATYGGGDTLHLEVRGHGAEPVFLDFVSGQQTLLTKMVELKEGRATLALELPEDVFGPIQLVAHRFDHRGEPRRQVRLLYVEQPNQVQIQAMLDRKAYRPGESAQVTFALTGADRQPVVGALSLSVVDEAVFS